MPTRRIFFSFHFDNDVMRVQQVRNIGLLDDNKPVTPQDWETVRGGGDASVIRWIDSNMKGRTCLVVLVGAETAKRKWVKYEIKKAWEDGLGVVGVRIHNLKCPREGISSPGPNPFDEFNIDGTSFSSIVKCHNPVAVGAYQDIRDNLENWVEDAIRIRSKY